IFSPSRMIDPLPNCFSIAVRVVSSALFCSSVAIFSCSLCSSRTLERCRHIGRSAGSLYPNTCSVRRISASEDDPVHHLVDRPLGLEARRHERDLLGAEREADGQARERARQAPPPPRSRQREVPPVRTAPLLDELAQRVVEPTRGALC